MTNLTQNRPFPIPNARRITLKVSGISYLEWQCISCSTWNNEEREICRTCGDVRPREVKEAEEAE